MPNKQSQVLKKNNANTMKTGPKTTDTDQKITQHLEDIDLHDDWLKTLMMFALYEYHLWPTNSTKTFNPELIDFACSILEWIGFVNYVRFYDGDTLGDDGGWAHTPRLECAMNKQLKRWKETREGFERRELKKHLKKWKEARRFEERVPEERFELRYHGSRKGVVDHFKDHPQVVKTFQGNKTLEK
jgi:hypothetical protein